MRLSASGGNPDGSLRDRTGQVGEQGNNFKEIFSKYMKITRLKLKNDKYRKARGGRTRLFSVHCEGCNSPLFLYQKDGPGPLKRVYIDRILAPNDLGKTKQLICTKCKKVIGTYYIYEKEKRPAYRLYQDAVVKKPAKVLR